METILSVKNNAESKSCEQIINNKNVTTPITITEIMVNCVCLSALAGMVLATGIGIAVGITAHTKIILAEEFVYGMKRGMGASAILMFGFPTLYLFY